MCCTCVAYALKMCLGSPWSCGASKPGGIVPHHPGGGAHDPQVREGNGPPSLLPCSRWSKEHLGSNMAQACFPKLDVLVFCGTFWGGYIFSILYFLQGFCLIFQAWLLAFGFWLFSLGFWLRLVAFGFWLLAGF